MPDSAVWTAFLLGIASAASLPLGALTGLRWTPSDRMQAILMAVGGGALLAALTIDLVASALAQGHFYPMALGALLGGLLFIVLNQLVNQHGGFLRKASTMFVYLRRQRQKRLKRILSRIGRIRVFRGLPSEDLMLLADAMEHRECRAGSVFYLRRDPCDALFVIEEGQVDLLDPLREMRPFEHLGPSDAFARMAFFTGLPQATVAVATTDTRVWMLPRSAFLHLLQRSLPLACAVKELLEGQEIRTYLRDRHGLEKERIEHWLQAAAASLQEHGWFEPPVQVDHHEEAFRQAVRNMRRAEIFHDLPPEDIEALSDRVIYQRYKTGETFFHKNESAERLYFLHQGEVALIDPANLFARPEILRDDGAFGALSFLTGSPHSSNAVATGDVSVWVLRRKDFDDLLRRSPQLEQALRKFIQQSSTGEYLRLRHHFHARSVERWIHRALKSMDAGRLLPSAAADLASFNDRNGAPVAIWLGILLDGIPESLVIGASLVHTHLSLSLIAGLFLANYPEALSSAVGMRQQGFRFSRVLLMWSSIMLFTGIGAALGNLFFIGSPPFLFSLTQGVAAGAMLVMIAETMLPEAYLKGGPVVGMSTLLGFLAAIFFKTLE